MDQAKAEKNKLMLVPLLRPADQARHEAPGGRRFRDQRGNAR